MEKLFLSLFCCFLFSAQIQAAAILNGSLNNPGIVIVDPSGPHNGATPLNWLQSGDDPTDINVDGSLFTTSDLFDPILSSVFGYSWVSSSDGGTFTHAIGMSDWQEGIRQMVSDLVPGKEYKITFEQSSSKSFVTDGISGYWQVSFGAETHNAALLAADDLNAWFPQSLLFTATSTMQELSFLALSSNGNRVDIAIDGIAIVPAPPIALLLATGLFGLMASGQKRINTPKPK